MIKVPKCIYSESFGKLPLYNVALYRVQTKQYEDTIRFFKP